MVLLFQYLMTVVPTTIYKISSAYIINNLTSDFIV